jgi:putative peptide zinc metalloprotease protein
VHRHPYFFKKGVHMKLSMTTQLKLVPLEIRTDKKNYIVEDLVSGEFYEMPEICIEAIKMIQMALSIDQIEFQLKEKYPEEEVDLLNFAGQLLELELVEEINGLKIESKREKQQNTQEFQWISPHAGRFFFNKLTVKLYLALFIVSLTLFIVHPQLLPSYKDLFIFNLMVLNIPAWMILTIVLVLIHEFGHILAIRSYDLPTRLGIGHRLFLVVLETDMSSVWKLGSKERNHLYFAGLCFDTLVLFIALAGQFSNASLIFHGVLRFIVLDTFIRMIYQLCVYMKTDLYYVIENSTGCYNLMENAQEFLKGCFRFHTKVSATGEAVFDNERKTVQWYSIFYLSGVTLTIFLYLFFYIPQLILALKRILPGLQASTATITFWDSVLFVFQILIGLVLLVYSWYKKSRKLA